MGMVTKKQKNGSITLRVKAKGAMHEERIPYTGSSVLMRNIEFLFQKYNTPFTITFCSKQKGNRAYISEINLNNYDNTKLSDNFYLVFEKEDWNPITRQYEIDWKGPLTKDKITKEFLFSSQNDYNHIKFDIEYEAEKQEVLYRGLDLKDSAEVQQLQSVSKTFNGGDKEQVYIKLKKV